VVLTVAILPQALSTSPLKIETGGIEKGQGKFAEEVSPSCKHGFLYFVLSLPQPAHRPVQVMQLQPFNAGDHHIPPPLLCRAVRSRHKQAVKHRKGDGSLYRELE
jgi:hypothetical protein